MEVKQTEEDTLRRFVEDVVKVSGATGVDVDSAVEAISAKIDEGIVDALPEETMNKMLALQEAGEVSDEQIEALLDESGVDPQPIAERVMEAFKNKMMEGAEA